MRKLTKQEHLLTSFVDLNGNVDAALLSEDLLPEVGVVLRGEVLAVIRQDFLFLQEWWQVSGGIEVKPLVSKKPKSSSYLIGQELRVLVLLVLQNPAQSAPLEHRLLHLVDVDVVDVLEGQAGVVVVGRHRRLRRRLEPLQEDVLFCELV